MINLGNYSAKEIAEDTYEMVSFDNPSFFAKFNKKTKKIEADALSMKWLKTHPPVKEFN